jgi:hypothetical protein
MKSAVPLVTLAAIAAASPVIKRQPGGVTDGISSVPNITPFLTL